MERNEAMTLHGKKVLIIGGTSGIGFATATASARAGATVVVASSSPERVARALEQLPESAAGHVVDASSEQAIAKLMEDVGEFDHLVFTAGEPLAPAEVSSIELGDARAFFETRYWGALAAAKHASRRIRPGGSIVLSSGGAGQRPAPGLAVAASVCGAVEALARALAVELAPLRVNAVAPGVVRTELWSPIPEDSREAFYKEAADAMLSDRVGEAEEVAQAHLYLMQNEFVTGTVLDVDGGAALV
jgi:NAD(P)-dependent dehydrogenase (short-subunit alcohol dehydrogenase family)